jgi:hypothetical protein
MTAPPHRLRPVLLLVVALGLQLALAPTAGAATAPPTRCAAPYDPAGTTFVGQSTMRASAPALRWLGAVYGAQAPQRRNVLREVAVRPCSIPGRGAITVWTTNPPAMIRRAWRQPWIGRVDIQWVRVGFGSREAFRAVRSIDAELLAAIEQRLGGPMTSAGDDPAHDCIHLGVAVDALPADAAAIGAELLGLPTCVEPELMPQPAT